MNERKNTYIILKKASGPTMVIEQERPKHYSASQIFRAMRGAESAEGAPLHAMHDDLTAGREGDQEGEDIVTECMEMVIEPALAIRNGSRKL